MIQKDHPYFFLESIYQKEDATFHLSKYVYRPDSLLDEREYILISGSDLTTEWVDSTIASLRDDQELAFHSKVMINNRTFHLPMIDLCHTNTISDEIMNRMRNFLPRDIFMNLGIFRSGRSYHAYSTRLQTPKNWIQLMGRLLLINKNNSNEIVDSRWIGHRLISGYSSLRWSNNTDQYLEYPSRIPWPF